MQVALKPSLNLEQGVCLSFALLVTALGTAFYLQRPASVTREIQDRPARAVLGAKDIRHPDLKPAVPAPIASGHDIFVPRALEESSVAVIRPRPAPTPVSQPKIDIALPKQPEPKPVAEPQPKPEPSVKPREVFPLQVGGFIEPEAGQPAQVIVSPLDDPTAHATLAPGDEYEVAGQKIRVKSVSLTAAVFVDGKGKTWTVDKDPITAWSGLEGSEQPADREVDAPAPRPADTPRNPGGQRPGQMPSPDIIQQFRNGKALSPAQLDEIMKKLPRNPNEMGKVQ